MSTIRFGLFFLILCGIGGCDIQSPDSPERIQRNSFNESTEFKNRWPGKPALFKLADNLILSIPPEHQKFWLQGNKVTRPPVQISQVPEVKFVGFEMFAPDFSGYTPSNYKNPFDPKLIEIISIEFAGMDQSIDKAPGWHTPNVFRRLIEARAISNDDFEEKYGLKCFREDRDRPNKIAIYEECLGSRGQDDSESLLIRVLVPPYEAWVKYPLMEARYFSKKYGGVVLIWRTHSENLPHWRAIDNKIWAFLDAWNIAEEKQK